MYSIHFEHLNNLFTNSQFSDNIWQPASQPSSLLKVQGFFRLRKWKERKKSIGRLTIGQPNYKLFKQVSYLETITQFTTKNDDNWLCVLFFFWPLLLSPSPNVFCQSSSVGCGQLQSTFTMSQLQWIICLVLFCFVWFFLKCTFLSSWKHFVAAKLILLIWKLLILSGEVFQKPVNRKTN